MSTGKTYSTKYLLDSNNNRGAEGQVLSSTNSGIDWVTLSEISGVDGTGTANYLSKWLDANTITNSLVYDNGTNVGIGTTAPKSLLNVTGTGSAGGILTLENNSTSLVTGRNVGQIDFYSNDSSSNGAGVKAKITAIAENSIGSEVGLTLGTSGTGSATAIEAIRIKSNGNVGIGATAPLRKLHVVGDFAVNAGTDEYYGVLINGGESANPKITIGDWHNSSATIHWDSSSNYLRIDSQHSSANAAIAFTGNDGSSEYMRITSAGNVGIGTNSPTNNSNYRTLDIRGTNGGQIIAGRAAFVDFFMYTDSSAVSIGALNDLHFKAGSNGGGTPKMAITSTGNVGIGTTSPAVRLHVLGGSGSGATADSAYQIVADSSGIAGIQILAAANQSSRIAFGDSADNDVGMVKYDHTNNAMSFNTSATEKVRIDSSGNVGIGTTSPQTKLHVKGDIGAYTSDYATGSTGSRLLMKTFASTGNTYSLIQAQDVGGTSNNVLALQPYGDNVGIGTTSTSHKLEVSGGLFASNYISINAANTNFNLYNNGTTYLNGDTQVDSDFIVTNGNVGIGTTSPSERLHVFSSSDPTIKIGGGVSEGTTGGTSTLQWWANNGTYGNAFTATYYKDASNDRLTFIDGGANNVLTLKNGGDVGIGTVSPGARLHVSEAGTANTQTIVAGLSSTSLRPVLQFSENANATINSGMSIEYDGRGTGTANKMHINGVDGAAKFTVTSGGSVGIGTTSPSSKLEVVEATANTAAAITVDSASWDAMLSLKNANGTWTILNDYTGAGTTGALAFWNGSYRMVIDNTGKVGIGTTSPSQTLHIVGGSADQLLIENGTSSGTSQIQFKANSNRNAGPFIKATQRGNSASDSDLQLGDESGTILTLNGGNVGIGTVSPDEVLEVKGIIKSENTGYTNTGIIINQTSHSDAWRLMQFGGGAFSLNLNGYTSGQSRFQVGTSGDVAIPAGTLTVSGTGDSSIAGNVGIGTTSPDAKLEVGTISSAEITTGLLLTNNVSALSAAGNGVGIIMGRHGGSYSSKIANVWTNNNPSYLQTNIAFYTMHNSHLAGSETEKMRLTSDGKLGIGTTNPSQELEVGGTVLANDYRGSSHIYLTSPDSWIFRSTAGTERMRITSAGNVGIGTTSPSTRLHVYEAVNRTTAIVQNNNHTARFEAYGTATAIDTTASNGVFIRQNGSNRAHFAASGNVGIGIDSPTYKLQVRSLDANDDVAYIHHDNASQTSGTVLKVRSDAGNSSGYSLLDVQNNTGNVLYVRGDRRVGIRTTAPARPLHVIGQFAIDNSTSPSGGLLVSPEGDSNKVYSRTGNANTTAHPLDFISGSSTSMRIAANGDVGIGTTSPSNALEISNASFADQLRVLRPQNTEGGIAGIINIAGNNSASVVKDYARIGVIIDDNTNATEDGSLVLQTITNGTNTEKVRINSLGNVGIGTTNPCTKLEVNGHFAATSKSFIIEHPTQKGKKLQYASLEGPENGVYVRGTTDKETIELPEYWSELVREDSITVVLTPIGKKQDLFIKEKSNKLIKIGGAEGSFDYVVYGERKDIDKLEIEPLKV